MHETSKRSLPPGTLSQGFRVRWAAGRDTWHAFVGKPCQVGGRKMPLGTLLREFRARWVTYRQGHTVALRRSFPQCGPLPFSGADAGFGLCMSLSSRIPCIYIYCCFLPLRPFLTTLGDPQKKHFFIISVIIFAKILKSMSCRDFILLFVD